MLNVHVPMLGELEPVEKRGEIWLFERKQVLDYFKQTEAFEWLEKQNALTRRLKKVCVRSEQERVEGGKRTRFYFVNLRDVKDFAERFGVDYDTSEITAKF